MSVMYADYQWSSQQQAFIDWCVKEFVGSCVLEAVAGAGKTTTILASATRMRGSVAILAYNKKIADEIKAKLKAADIDWKKVNAGTVHSFGFNALRKTFPQYAERKDWVNNNKVEEYLEVVVKDEQWIPYIGQIAHLVSLGKQRALGVMGRIEDEHEWRDIIEHFGLFEDDEAEVIGPIIQMAQDALKVSNKDLAKIDFDDMVYMPLVHKLRFWQYDVVMVDEAQDTNPARRALVRAVVRKGGRVIAVGDRHQAIYGFTGADSDALDLIAHDFNCIQMPLTITYRCPKAVVKFSQQWVNHIQAAETAPEGEVSKITMKEFIATGQSLDKHCAVLCRLTKPLISLAFTLIRSKVPCRVEGRDIAAGLRKLIQRWKVKTTAQLEERLEAYLAKETTKLLAKKRETKLQLVEDTVETIKTIIDQCRAEKKYGIEDVTDYVDRLFADNVTDMLVLSTIHKAKGREWKNVYWLDRAGTCPSKWARQGWQQEQERNLCYVAATRAQERLIELFPAVPEEKNKEEAKPNANMAA